MFGQMNGYYKNFEYIEDEVKGLANQLNGKENKNG